MANWQRTLDIVDVWERTQEEQMSPQELAGFIAVRLEKLTNFNDPEVDNIKIHLIEKFKEFSQDESLEEDEFNTLMNDLYNWADIRLDNKFGGKRVCWIKTY